MNRARQYVTLVPEHRGEHAHSPEVAKLADGLVGLGQDVHLVEVGYGACIRSRQSRVASMPSRVAPDPRNRSGGGANVPGLEDDIVLMDEAVVVRRMELEMRVRSMYL